MKLKKTLTSKPFIAGTLAILCVGILGTCLLLQRNNQDEFIPEPSSSAAPVESWTENDSVSTPEKEIGMNDGMENTSEEEYPKVTEGGGDQTVIDFTDPEPSKPAAPPAPEGKTVVPEPESSHPVKKDPTVTPPKEEPPKSNTPTPGSTNDKGQVYDPAFGWVTLSPVEQIPTDNDGDPNKMVGSMD